MKKIILFALLSIPLSIASDAFAQKGKGQGGMPPVRRGDLLRDIVFFGGFESIYPEKKRLLLTDEQAEKIAGLNINYKTESSKLDENIRRMQFELDNLLREDSMSLHDIRALLTEISKLEVEKGMLRIVHQLEIEKILTSAQRDMLRNKKPYRFNSTPD